MLTLALVPALACAQLTPAVKVQQDGVQIGGGWWSTLDCVTPVTCTRTASTGVVQITSSGGGGGGAPTNATYITQTANASLTNEQALSSLSTGVVKVTTGTGVLSTAVSGTDYAPPTSGTALQLGNGSGGFSGYAGASCTNQFPRSLSAAGAATCASVSLASDITGTLAAGNGGLGATQPTCSAGQFLTCNGTTCSCSTPSSSGANSLEQSVVLSEAGVFSQAITGQTWVTSSSKIVCSIFGTTADSLTPEAIAVAQLTVVAHTRVAGTGFTITIANLGGLVGTVRVHCLGV